jgi:hypothetical protein
MFAGRNATNVVAQSPKEQIAGAWTLVSADSVRPDGSKVQAFGPNPKGIMLVIDPLHRQS